MIEKKITNQRDLFFTKQFNYYLKNRWLKSGRTKKQFREAIIQAYESDPSNKGKKCKLTKDSITQWTQGVYPEKYFKYILQILQLPESVFSIEGNPEYDERMQHELDQVRIEYAREIGLDKNFMLFILHSFTGAEWGRKDFYYYLKDHGEDKYFPDEKDSFGTVLDGISQETMESLQCRFKGIPEMGEGQGNMIHLPTKKDLDFMLLLQKKVEKHIRIELDELEVMIEKDMYNSRKKKTNQGK